MRATAACLNAATAPMCCRTMARNSPTSSLGFLADPAFKRQTEGDLSLELIGDANNGALGNLRMQEQEPLPFDRWRVGVRRR